MQKILRPYVARVGKGRHGRPDRGQPPRRSRVALGPAMSRRWTFGRRPGRCGQCCFGLGPGASDRGQPAADVPASTPAGESRDRDEFLAGRWQHPGCLDDRGIGQYPPRGQIPPPGDHVALQPEFADDRQATPGVDPVNTRCPPPWIRAWGGWLGGEDRRELLGRPFVFSLLLELLCESVPE